MKRDLNEFLADWDSLHGLIQQRVLEGADLDYKREEYAATKKPPERRDADRQELRRDVASIANAGGGWIVIGVSEDERGDPSEVCSIGELAGNEARTRDLLSRQVEPSLGRHATVRSVACPDLPDRGVLVVEIQAADSHRPFAVVDENGLLEFWTRFDRKKAPMTYAQLVGTFSPTEEEMQGHQLAANARFRIRGIRHAIKETGHDWNRRAALVGELRAFVHDPSRAVRSEIADAISEALDRPRSGLPLDLARAAVSLLNDTLPYHNLLSRQERAPTNEDVAVLEEAARSMWILLSDGIRHRKSLPIMWAGLELCADLLRFARLNDLAGLETCVTSVLERAADTAKKSGDGDAKRLLDYADLFATDFDCDLPAGLEWVIHGEDSP